MAQLFPSRAGDDVVRLLIEGSTGTDHIRSPLEDPRQASHAAAACTDVRFQVNSSCFLLDFRSIPHVFFQVTIHGLELDAYNEAMRSYLLRSHTARVESMQKHHPDSSMVLTYF
jgi:hypothetical protein